MLSPGEPQSLLPCLNLAYDTTHNNKDFKGSRHYKTAGPSHVVTYGIEMVSLRHKGVSLDKMKV